MEIDERIEAMIEDVFSYHPATDAQKVQYEAVRAGAKAFAKILLANTPPCPDQTFALRELRNSVMTANASIALEGRTTR